MWYRRVGLCGALAAVADLGKAVTREVGLDPNIPSPLAGEGEG
jgi:hypothetical protein